MRIKIDGTIYSSEEVPIMLILNSYEKERISKMVAGDNAFVAFPRGLSTFEVASFIGLPPDPRVNRKILTEEEDDKDDKVDFEYSVEGECKDEG